MCVLRPQLLVVKVANMATADLSRIARLCDEGRYLTAYEASRALGPLKTWRGQPALLLAGRLASVLGALRLAASLRYLAWRADRRSPQAQLAHATTLANHRSPFDAWKFLRRCGELATHDITLHSDWLVMQADLASMFRDFDAAQEWHEKAAGLTPDRSWLWARRAANLVWEDRYDEAHRAAARALALQPAFPPAVRQCAETLVLLGRDEEALRLLVEAARDTQCGYVWLDLANLQSEMGQHAQAYDSYQHVL